MRRLVVILLAVGLVAAVTGLVWFMLTLSDFMERSQADSEELLDQIEISCPPQTTRVGRPSGKAGWQVFCQREGTRHGPWLAAENGRLWLRGEYREGERYGVWEWYDEDGVVAKRVIYNGDGSLGEAAKDGDGVSAARVPNGPTPLAAPRTSDGGRKSEE
jgi:hypothetical protein